MRGGPGAGRHRAEGVPVGVRREQVSVLAFGISQGFTFTKTTLMASFSLHDRVFDKVQAPHLSPQGLPVHRYISQWGLLITCDVPDTVLSSGVDTAHGAYSRVWEESPSIYLSTAKANFRELWVCHGPRQGWG